MHSRFRFDCDIPDPLEVNEVCLYFNAGNRCPKVRSCHLQFSFVMPCLCWRVPTKSHRQAIVRATVRMQHQDYALRTMQTNRFTNLVEDKLAVCLMFGGRQTLCAPCDLDGI